MIPKPASPRKLLTRTVRLATLVVVGVAETACNLQVGPPEDAGRDDAGTDAASDVGADVGAVRDTGIDGSGP